MEVVRQTELVEAGAKSCSEPRVQSEIVIGTLRQHYFAITVAAVLAGEAAGAVVVLHDITELRKLERVRRDFVANVSHELRTRSPQFKALLRRFSRGAIDDPQNRTRFLRSFSNIPAGCTLNGRSAHAFQDGCRTPELEIRRLSVSQLIESCLETAQRRAVEKICESP